MRTVWGVELGTWQWPWFDDFQTGDYANRTKTYDDVRPTAEQRDELVEFEVAEIVKGVTG
jgi:hypothetical protein